MTNTTERTEAEIAAIVDEYRCPSCGTDAYSGHEFWCSPGYQCPCGMSGCCGCGPCPRCGSDGCDGDPTSCAFYPDNDKDNNHD